jgi:hypothetical protein
MPISVKLVRDDFSAMSRFQYGATESIPVIRISALFRRFFSGGHGLNVHSQIMTHLFGKGQPVLTWDEKLWACVKF